MPATILVLDGNELHTMLIQKILENDYEVITSITGYIGLNIIQHSQVDLLIMVLRLRDMEAWSLLDYIRESQPLIPVLIVSAFTDPASLERAFNLGCKGYLNKPFNIADLKSVVGQLLSNK